MTNNKVKVSFLLSEDEIGDGPIDSESLWCLELDRGLQILNIPMFLSDLSYLDIVETKAMDNQKHDIINTIEKSDNSTLWVVVKNEDYDNDVVEQLKKMGCQVEGGKPEGYFGVNVPSQVDIDCVYDFITDYTNKEILEADYPSIRQ